MRRKHSNRGRNYTIRTGSAPTKERRRQNGGVTFDVIDRDYHNRILVKRYRAVCECPLDAYVETKAISVAEHWAGLKFREAYFRAVLCRRAAYDRISRYTPNSDPVPGEKVLKEAYRAMSPHYRAAVTDICGHDQPARDEVKLDKLKKGLGQLACHWRAATAQVIERS